MKPATQARIDRIMNGHQALLKLWEMDRIPIREAIRLALLEQDRDTRHACAEAILDLPHDMTHTDAQRAVMNVQAV